MLAPMSTSKDALLDHVRAVIAAHDMLRAGDRVLAAASGGPDSVALVHALRELGYPVEIAHFDHQTRGGQSAQDAQFVARLAKRLGIPCHVGSRPVAREARETGRSFEQHARDARYAFLLRIARERSIGVIATGHHADDQAETLLLRIIRGSGIHGLAGIPPVRVAEGLRIVRPLLDCSRPEILAYLKGKRLRYCTDVTNADQSIPRNRVRHELLPLLERRYNPGVRAALLRLAEMQRLQNALLRPLEEEALARSVNAAGAIDRAQFAGLTEALRRGCVARLAQRWGVGCDFARVLAATAFILYGATGRRLDIGGGVYLYNSRAATFFVSSGRKPVVVCEPLLIPGETRALGRRFVARRLDNAPDRPLRAYCTPARQVFDADEVGARLYVRVRRPGDRFAPLGMHGEKKLSDFFIDRGVPAPCRDAVPLIADDARIFWVVGYMPSSSGAVGPRTRHFLEIEAALEPGETAYEAD